MSFPTVEFTVDRMTVQCCLLHWLSEIAFVMDFEIRESLFQYVGPLKLNMCAYASCRQPMLNTSSVPCFFSLIFGVVQNVFIRYYQFSILTRKFFDIKHMEITAPQIHDFWGYPFVFLSQLGMQTKPYPWHLHSFLAASSLNRGSKIRQPCYWTSWRRQSELGLYLSLPVYLRHRAAHTGSGTHREASSQSILTEPADWSNWHTTLIVYGIPHFHLTLILHCMYIAAIGAALRPTNQTVNTSEKTLHGIWMDS